MPRVSLHIAGPELRPAAGRKPSLLRLTAAVLCLVWLSSTGPADAKKIDIGVTAAVQPQATGTPPGAQERILTVGLDLFANERIVTGARGRTHLLFLDGSTITVGPRSELTLDTFVYDPATGKGDLAVSTAKGLFRFVGGRISKQQAVKFKTPTAVIGIRGGMAILEVNDPAGSQPAGAPPVPPVSVTMLFGDEVSITTPTQNRTMNRPGFGMSANPDGTVNDPAPASQQDLNRALQSLEDPPQPEEGEGDETSLGEIAPAAGGPAVSDEDVAGSQMSELGSENSPDSLGGPAPDGAPPTPSNNNEATSESENASQQTATEAANLPIGATGDSDAAQNAVLETAAPGTPVGVMAMATDPNSRDRVSYKLTSNPGGNFTIDPQTGRITVAPGGTLDFETTQSLTVTARATSSDGTFSEQSFVIQLLDDRTEFQVGAVSDTDQAGNTVVESAAGGSAAGLTALAIDGDGSDVVSYALSNDAGGLFVIDAASGVVRLAPGASLDAETATEHSIEVLASSSDGSTRRMTFAIMVADDNSEFSATPVSDANGAANVANETSGNGTQTGLTAFSLDQDVSDSVGFSLPDDAGGRFAIDPDTGVVTVADAGLLSFNDNRRHTVGARADSTDGSFATQSFTIELAKTSFVGRSKRGTSTASGTNDGVATDVLSLPTVTLVSSTFSSSTGQGDFSLFFPDTAGSFAVGGANLPVASPYGAVSGTVFLSADQEFVRYSLVESISGARQLVFAGDATPDGNFPTSGFSSYGFLDDFGLNAIIPFVRASAGGNLTDRIVSPGLISWSTGGAVSNPLPVFGQASFAFNPSGGAGGLIVATGLVRTDSSGRPFIDGAVSGSFNALSGSGAGAVLIKGPISTLDDPNGRDFYGTSGPKYFTLEGAAVNDSDVTQQIGLQELSAGNSAGRVSTSYFPNVTAISQSAAGIGASRTSRTLNGFVSGDHVLYFSGQSPGPGFSLVRGKLGDGNDLVLTTNAVEGKIDVDMQVRAEFFGNHNYVLKFGGINADPTSAFIDDDLFVAREEQASGNSTRNGSPSTSETLAFASSGMIPLPASLIPGGVTLCACDFMRWGHWTADIEVAGDADRMHLSHWVAGTIANAAQIAPLNGSASFSGHAVGTINDSGVRQFVADMTTSYDFGTRSGSVNITNLEGQNFQYTINGINGSEHTFSGALTTAPSPDFTGNTRGAFYNDGASIAQGVGGDFYWRDTDTAASAVGVFVGQR